MGKARVAAAAAFRILVAAVSRHVQAPTAKKRKRTLEQSVLFEKIIHLDVAVDGVLAFLALA
ncbi:MAG: hypothetical protein K2L11_03435 [Muribaculaceae bacterium]|nr:hypothetical protein [Muribaculaceae bacterium]